MLTTTKEQRMVFPGGPCWEIISRKDLLDRTSVQFSVSLLQINL
jgi:hypothetical protein